MKSVLSLGLIGLTTIISVSKAQTDNPNCTIFDWDGQPGYLQNDTVQRISAAATCEPARNETHECPIVAHGDAAVQYKYNISSTLRSSYWHTPHGSENYIHSLILSSVNSSLDGMPWPDYAIGAIDTTETLEPGTSGYIQFTPYLRCFAGILSNCTGGIEDGIGIEACAPVIQTLWDSVGVLQGDFSIEKVAEDEVSHYRDPYSGQSSGDASSSVPRQTGRAILVAALTLITASILQ